jgi:hypothetical protein
MAQAIHFRKLEGTPRQIIEPVDGVALKRNSEFVWLDFAAPTGPGLTIQRHVLHA